MDSPADNHDQGKAHGNYMWLISVIAMLSVVGLAVIYHVIPLPFANKDSSSFDRLLSSLFDLGRNVIPSLVAAILAFLAIYWLLSKRGLVPSQLEQEASEGRVLRAIKEAVQAPATRPNAVVGFYPAFQQVEWGALIEGSQLRIDIVVNYFDSWVKDNRPHLINFFKKPKAVLHLYIPDPQNAKVLAEIKELYTDNSEAVLREKIEKTEKRFLELIQEAGAPSRS